MGKARSVPGPALRTPGWMTSVSIKALPAQNAPATM